MVTISEGAFAKVNLTLDVLDKREDGYHNIKSVMQTISLHDDVTVDIGTNAPWQVHCYREVLDETDRENPTTTLVTEGYPQNEENLVWKATGSQSAKQPILIRTMWHMAVLLMVTVIRSPVFLSMPLLLIRDCLAM